jgi:hypothetical protein
VRQPGSLFPDHVHRIQRRYRSQLGTVDLYANLVREDRNNIAAQFRQRVGQDLGRLAREQMHAQAVYLRHRLDRIGQRCAADARIELEAGMVRLDRDQAG